MPFRYEKERVKAYCDKAAEALFRNWRAIARKDLVNCVVGLAWDGGEIVTISIPWEELPEFSLLELQDIFFEACYQPRPEEMN